MQVKKEKLGERITALQQLVSPFGKVHLYFVCNLIVVNGGNIYIKMDVKMQTDTASVLHEAMGYIRFLHDQVHVLCSPYLQRQTQRQSPSLRVSTFVLTNSLFTKKSSFLLLD